MASCTIDPILGVQDLLVGLVGSVERPGSEAVHHLEALVPGDASARQVPFHVPSSAAAAARLALLTSVPEDGRSRRLGRRIPGSRRPRSLRPPHRGSELEYRVAPRSDTARISTGRPRTTTPTSPGRMMLGWPAGCGRERVRLSRIRLRDRSRRLPARSAPVRGEAEFVGQFAHVHPGRSRRRRAGPGRRGGPRSQRCGSSWATVPPRFGSPTCSTSAPTPHGSSPAWQAFVDEYGRGACRMQGSVNRSRAGARTPTNWSNANVRGGAEPGLRQRPAWWLLCPYNTQTLHDADRRSPPQPSVRARRRRAPSHRGVSGAR